MSEFEKWYNNECSFTNMTGDKIITKEAWNAAIDSVNDKLIEKRANQEIQKEVVNILIELKQYG